MATEILTTGANDLQDSSWSNDGIDDGDDLIIEGSSVAITENVNWSSLGAGGVESASVGWAQTADFGSASSPFTIEVNASTDAYFRYLASAGTLYYEIDTKCERFIKAGGSAAIITGGLCEDLEVAAGTVTLGADATCTNYYQFGGSVTMEYSSTVITAGQVTGGTLRLKRGGTFTVGGNTTIIIDLDTAGPSLTINCNDSRVRFVHLRGNVTINGYAGNYSEQLKRPATLNGTVGPSSSMRLNYGDMLTNNTTVKGYTQAGDQYVNTHP